MARPKNKFTVANLQRRGSSYRVYWGSHSKRTAFSIGQISPEEAQERLAEINLALINGDWPTWAKKLPAIQKYALDKSLETGKWNSWTKSLQPKSEKAANAKKFNVPVGDVLADYLNNLKANVSETHIKNSIAHIRELKDYSEKKYKTDLLEVTPEIALSFMEYIITSPIKLKGRRKGIVRSKATANRIKSSCSRFYKWCTITKGLQYNPFSTSSGVSSFKEPKKEIKFFSRSERQAILDNFDEAGIDAIERMVIMLAAYTGMRRGEIMLLEWRDINFKNSKLHTKEETKTGKRFIPLHKDLLTYLESVPEKSRKGRVVKWGKDYYPWDRCAKLLLKKLADFHNDIPRDHFEYYTFRHTFASLLVQDGVSLDKVCAWLGTSLKVVLKHYADFIPKDEKDNDIDKL